MLGLHLRSDGCPDKDIGDEAGVGKGLRGDWRGGVGLQPFFYGSSLIGMPVCCYDGILHLCLHMQQLHYLA